MLTKEKDRLVKKALLNNLWVVLPWGSAPNPAHLASRLWARGSLSVDLATRGSGVFENMNNASCPTFWQNGIKQDIINQKGTGCNLRPYSIVSKNTRVLYMEKKK